MTKIYVAHPFSGKPENVQSVEGIIKQLIKVNPDTLYISPIHATGFLYSAVPYDLGMKYCFELLALCDALMLCEGWEKSRGCNLEREYAILHDIPIVYPQDGFTADKPKMKEYLD